MTFRNKPGFWREIAHSIEDTSAYPGYMHKCFGSFHEFDLYMQELDPDWKNTEWGRFLLKTDTVEPEHSSIDHYTGAIANDVSNAFTANKSNYEFMARELIKAGINDTEVLLTLLRSTPVYFAEYLETTVHHYKPEKATVERYISKYGNRRRALRKTPKHIVVALIKLYTDNGLSLRETAQKLSRNEGIQLSYERIRELLSEEPESI